MNKTNTDRELLESVARTVLNNANAIARLEDDVAEIKSAVQQIARLDRIEDRVRIVETKLGIDPRQPTPAN